MGFICRYPYYIPWESMGFSYSTGIFLWKFPWKYFVWDVCIKSWSKQEYIGYLPNYHVMFTWDIYIYIQIRHCKHDYIWEEWEWYTGAYDGNCKTMFNHHRMTLNGNPMGDNKRDHGVESLY